MQKYYANTMQRNICILHIIKILLLYVIFCHFAILFKMTMFDNCINPYILSKLFVKVYQTIRKTRLLRIVFVFKKRNKAINFRYKKCTFGLVCLLAFKTLGAYYLLSPLLFMGGYYLYRLRT